MNSTFQLSPDQASALAEKYGSPLVVLSLKQAEQNYRTLSDWLNRVKLHYAMKSNPAEPLLKTFADLGSGFDVATIGEIKTLLQLGVDPSRLIYANPTKPENWIAQAWKLGVTRFTYDSPAEVGKIAANAPGASVWLRVRIANPGALVNLNSKFGASQADALDLLQLAKSKGLDVAGLSFHVGSQTRDSGPYLNSLAVCRRIFNEAAEMGVPLRSLDIGGGFPIVELGYDIDQETMDSQIRDELEDLFPETELLAEPGRALCGTTANLITSVIGKQGGTARTGTSSTTASTAPSRASCLTTGTLNCSAPKRARCTCPRSPARAVTLWTSYSATVPRRNWKWATGSSSRPAVRTRPRQPPHSTDSPSPRSSSGKRYKKKYRFCKGGPHKGGPPFLSKSRSQDKNVKVANRLVLRT